MSDVAPTSTPPHMHDEDEDVPCYRHPDRLTAIRCVTCDRPICIEECATTAAVGFKCPDDARTSRAARGEVPTSRLLRGSLAGIATALVLGVVLAYFSPAFLGIILAYLAGLAIGEATRRGSGGFRDPTLAKVAGWAAFIGVLALPLLSVIGNLDQPADLARLFWPFIAAVAAAVGAYSRAV